MTAPGGMTLRGLQPQPLSSYLGALGLLRICSAQHSNRVRGAFSPEGFALFGISREELMTLLLDRWSPTPVLSPWNNASGFYDSDKADATVAALSTLTNSALLRFTVLNRTIEQVRQLVREAGRTQAPKNKEKAAFISMLRAELPDESVEWIDAVAVIDDDDARLMPMLGSGGNDGALEYSGLFLRSLVEAVLGDRARSQRLLGAALDGTVVGDLVNERAGQFTPGSAGGANAGPGFDTELLPNNPWSFLLMIEGAVVWAGGLATRQQGSASNYRFAVSPFTVRHKAAGYGSAGRSEDDPKRVRAEVWVPVWRRPTELAEIRHFIAEGRVEVRSRPREVRRATNSLDFADAVASLGVDRGVDSFVRYVFIVRRGKSYLAMPAGVVEVRHRREVDLLRQLERELTSVDRFLSQFPSEQGPPAHLVTLRRAIDDAHFGVVASGGEQAMIRLVRAIGALEKELARRDPGKEPQLSRPPGGLGPEWISACGDSAEVQLAAALASLAPTGGAGPMRSYLAPLDVADPRRYAPAARPATWIGATLADRLAQVLQRRLLDVRLRGSGGATNRNPTWGAWSADLDDVARFIEGDGIDETALEDLLFGFSWVDLSQHHRLAGRSGISPPLPRPYALLKLAFLPQGVPVGDEKIPLIPDASLIPLLRTGRIHQAVQRARQQLIAKGFRPRTVTDPAAAPDPALGRKIAAALLIPISSPSALLRDALMPATSTEPRFEENPNPETTNVR